MARRSGGGGRAAPRAPSRPTVPAKAPAPQNRPSSTMAAPHQGTAAGAPPQASQGPGLFGQMASTAAGVAVGSTIGHTLGNLFTGGSSAAPAEQTPVAAQQTQNDQFQNNCAGVTQQFTKCMDDHNGNMQICNWYLEQLKACQAASSQY